MEDNLLTVLIERIQIMKKQLQRNISTRDKLNDKIEKLEIDVMAYERTLLTEKKRLGQEIPNNEEMNQAGRFSELPAHKVYLICLEELAKEKFIHEKQIWEKATEGGLQVDGKPISRIYSRSLLQRLAKQGKAIKGERVGMWKYNNNGTERPRIKVMKPFFPMNES